MSPSSFNKVATILIILDLEYFLELIWPRKIKNSLRSIVKIMDEVSQYKYDRRDVGWDFFTFLGVFEEKKK